MSSIYPQRNIITCAALFFAALFSFFAIANDAHAAIIIQRPLYVGLTEGLVGAWSFDGPDMAGVIAYDRSGQGNNGTLTNGPKKVAGKIGQGLEFDGVDDRVEVPFSSSLNFAGNITMAAWIYPKISNAFQTIIVRAPSGCFRQYAYYLSNAGTGFIYIGLGSVNLGNVAVSPAWAVNRWNHIVVTADGTNVKTYINGVLANNTASTLVATTHASAPVVLARDNACGDYEVNGLIDDVRIYNRALSPDEIKRLYNIGGTLKVNAPRYTDSLTKGLVGAWSFDGPDMSATKAHDRSGNGNDGVLTNGPVRTIGKIGQALEFDGVNDYVDVGVGPTSINTVAFWVHPKTTTEFFVNVTGTTDNIAATAGTILAAGFSSPTIYVDGIISSTLVANRWQHVVVTTATAENASDLDIGRTKNVNYVEGLIDDVRIYNRALSPQEIQRLYKIGSTFKVNAPRYTDSLTKGLVGAWSFDGPDMAGNSAFDRSSTFATGTLTNGPKRAIGKIGQALEFDGVNDYVNAGSLAILDNMSTSTISAWIYRDKIAGEEDFIAKSTGTGWLLRTGGTFWTAVNFIVAFTGTDLSRTTAGGTFNSGRWYHIAATWNGFPYSSDVHIYIDGAEAAYGSGTDPTGTKDNEASTNLVFGAFSAGSSSFTDGRIDDVRIYNRALSADEIKRLYQIGR